MDVIPGRENAFELTPNKKGVFAGKCAELCGTYHSNMLFNVQVVPRAEFEAHIAALKAAGQSGTLETGGSSPPATPAAPGRIDDSGSSSDARQRPPVVNAPIPTA